MGLFAFDWRDLDPRVYPSDLLGWDRAELLALALILLAAAGVLLLFGRWRRRG